MKWRLFGRIPFLSAQGPDVARSALGRHLGELCFVPAAALSPFVSWEHLDDRRSTGPEATYDGFTIPVGCRAGWWHCPDGCAKEEFIRFALEEADYR